MNTGNDLLNDLEPSVRKSLLSTKWRIILIVLSAAVATVNIVDIYQKTIQFAHINPAFQSKNILKTFIPTLFLVIPLAGFILAIGFSLIPYKGYSYHQKYVPFALILILLLELTGIVISYGGF